MHYDEIQTYTDGGSRGNPGPAASGMVILDAEGNTIEEFGVYLGTVTNNVAEWLALKYVLEAAAKYTPKRIRAKMDSELVCKQINGIYRVKHPDLIPIFQDVVKLAKQYDITFEHVYREHNKAADAQVNLAIDRALGRR